MIACFFVLKGVLQEVVELERTRLGTDSYNWYKFIRTYFKNVAAPPHDFSTLVETPNTLLALNHPLFY